MAPKKRLSAKKCHLLLLKTLKKLSVDERKDLIDRMNDESVLALSEAMFNVLKTDFGISARRRRNLRKKLLPHSKELRMIVKPDLPIAKRRYLIKKQQGAGFGVLLSALVPILSTLIANKIAK